MKKIMEFDMTEPSDVNRFNIVNNIDMILAYIQDQAKSIQLAGDSKLKEAYLTRYKILCEELDFW